MFGFAIWDDAQTLLLARDRVGIGPLHCVNGLLLVWFRIKAILADPAVTREWTRRHRLVPDVLLRSGNRALFRNIFKLEPGHDHRTAGGRTDVRRAGI
jgi:asparagine synthetase B (glutamine-hydrolysing)